MLGNFAGGVRGTVHEIGMLATSVDTNRMIRDSFSAAPYPVPEQHFRVQSPAS